MAPSGSAATVSWVSTPVNPGETALLSGGGFATATFVTLLGIGGINSTVRALDASESALKFTLPQSGPHAYDVVVSGSKPLPINLPEPWWWQGDAGNASTESGWLRVFGRGLVPVTGNGSAEDAASAEQKLQYAATQAMERRDYARARTLLAQLEQCAAAHARKSATLLLVNDRGDNVTLTSAAANTSSWSALFDLTAAHVPAGEYRGYISNGLATPSHPGRGWVPLTMFAAPHAPKWSTIVVRKPPQWEPRVFEVDCEWHKPLVERPCGWVGARSSSQLDAALQAARDHGGGIVHLPRGQYYLDTPLVVPNGTRVRGEGMHLVALYFRESPMRSSPRPGYVYADAGASAWAVTDMSMYVTFHYHSVVHVPPSTSDFTLQRVRIRAVAWAFLSDPIKGATGRGGRTVDFTRTDVGSVVHLDGCSNWKVLDCDLLGTGVVLGTGSAVSNHGASATWGVAARNTLWNANAAHWFDSIKQVIFEYNTIRPGGAEMTWGNNIDNYSPGYTQHVYHAHNSFQHCWAGDRELMTTDPVTGDYFGAVATAANDSSILNLVRPPYGNGSASTSNVGGAVSVLDGSGAGQYRRIVEVLDGGRAVRLDRPFDTPLDGTSRVQLGRFKGRFLFHANRYEDGGAFQLYANALDVVVSEHAFARTEGLLSWGRANPSAGGHIYCPNLRVEFVGNVVEEGNHVWNYNGSYPYPHPKTIEPYWFGILGSDQDVQPCPHGSAPCPPSQPAPFQGPINHLIVLRRNTVLSNGGIAVRGHTTNVLLEANAIHNSSVDVHVNSTHASHVLVLSSPPKGPRPPKASTSSSTWTHLATVGASPPPRYAAAAAAVTLHAQHELLSLLLFGGCAANATPLGDTWAYTNGTWAELPRSTPMPRARCGHSMTSDPGERSVLYLFGGHTDGSGAHASDELWQLDVPRRTWTQLPSGGSGGGPSARSGQSLNYLSGQLVAFGGCGAAQTCFGDTYGFDVTGVHGHVGTWRAISTPTSPPARAWHVTASYYGSAGQPFLFVYGGKGRRSQLLADLWRFDGFRWSELQALGTSPGPRYGALGAVLQSWDHPVASLLVTGGLGNGSTPLADDSYEYDTLTNTWLVGAAPAPGVGRAMGVGARLADPPSALTVFGGTTTPTGSKQQLAAGTWRYELGAAPPRAMTV